MSKNQMVDIDLSFLQQKYEEFDLPSGGFPYSKSSPVKNGKIHIRPWLTSEEKLVDKFNENNYYYILCQLASCAVKEKINPMELTVPDLNYIIYIIRSLTYNNVYSIETTCPKCGEQVSLNIRISDFPCTYIVEEIPEVLDIDMPISNDKDSPVIKLKMHLPKVKDLIEASNINEKDKMVNTEIYRYALCTEEMVLPNNEGTIINRKSLPDFVNYTVKKIWKVLPASSINYIRDKISEYDHGLIKNIFVNCPNCRGSIEVAPVLSWDFFHPDTRKSSTDTELSNDI